MAKNNADLLVGVGPNRPDKAWRHLYRAIEHSDAKRRCEKARALGFPPGIVSCANAFVALQQLRHSADYDPTYKIGRADALAMVAQAEKAIKDLRASPRKDRRAFAVQLLFERRKN
jgi:hypothetical protein